MSKLNIIGHTEVVELPDYHDGAVVAKVDTGADMSSIWASNTVVHKDGSLAFVLFGEKSSHYTGTVITIPEGEYTRTRIANSFGDKELRYVVKLRIRIRGRVMRASFSLADRSKKRYPILLGKKVLHKKFLVDVSQGETPKKQLARKKRKT